MKDALREYGRTVAIFAAAGLVLSLLVGLLARNPFGVMLIRAVLFAVAFGGVGVGMQYVVRRFLPELAGGEAAGPEGGDDAAAKPAGSTIDIVLPEEPPPAQGSSEARSETLEELPGTTEAIEADAVEELDGAEPAPAPSPAERTRGPARIRDGLDALPDIGSVGTGGDTTRNAPRFPGARRKPSDATRDVLEREDPATLARAVRTVLKREERP
ncbi:MAG: hypothetical protein NTU62_18070 [Spirochaetes bacterium]|nr:hypothetical protein [Spirochaetota bacterium]